MLSGQEGHLRAAFRRAPCLAFARFDSLRDFFNGLLELLADLRRGQGESYVAGGVASNVLLDAPRHSRDSDLFHDTPSALQFAVRADREHLTAAGFEVRTLREAPTFVEAEVRRAGQNVLLQWTAESAFRFFPLIEHDRLCLTLHPFDLGTNKALAMAGRLEPRDWIGALACDERLQPLGLLVRAACGKDPGYNPTSLLAEISRAHCSQAELDTLEFSGARPDAAQLGARWHAVLQEARALCAALPAAGVGRCVATSSGELFRGSAGELARALSSGQVAFHSGRIPAPGRTCYPPRTDPGRRSRRDDFARAAAIARRSAAGELRATKSRFGCPAPARSVSGDATRQGRIDPRIRALRPDLSWEHAPRALLFPAARAPASPRRARWATSAQVDPRAGGAHDGPRMIALDTHRQALRAAMPWWVLALGPLVLAVAAPALAGAFAGDAGPAPWIVRGAALLGLLGSAAMLIGLLQLARARSSGRRRPALVLALALWLAEFAARVWPAQAGDDAPPGALAGVQLVASSAAMWCAATGLIWILRRQQAGAAIAPWQRVRLAFAALTIGIALLVALSRGAAPASGLEGWIAAPPLGPALAWLAFATPWALLVVAVRASLRWLGRARSTAEILAR